MYGFQRDLRYSVGPAVYSTAAPYCGFTIFCPYEPVERKTPRVYGTTEHELQYIVVSRHVCRIFCSDP